MRSLSLLSDDDVTDSSFIGRSISANISFVMEAIDGSFGVKVLEDLSAGFLGRSSSKTKLSRRVCNNCLYVKYPM